MKKILILKIKIEFVFFIRYFRIDTFNNLSQVLAKQPPSAAFPSPSGGALPLGNRRLYRR